MFPNNEFDGRGKTTRQRLPLLLHWWWLFWEPIESGRRGYNYRKSWRVIYNDGKPYNRSIPLPYGTAVDMVKIFEHGYIERVNAWEPPSVWEDAE